MTVDYRDSSEAAHQDKLHFFYDAQSRPAKVSYNGVIYTYIHNLQGDIVGLLDNSGALVVEYRYDAWGKAISTTGSLAATLGKRNPFRYRGYIYDEETGLYYLRSRYYNPGVGRFVNADSMFGKLAGLKTHNLYEYCLSTPICRSDASGNTSADAYDFYLRAAQADGPYVVGDIIGIFGALGILAYGEILKHISKSKPKTSTSTRTQTETTNAPSPTPTVSPSPTPKPHQEYFPVNPFDFHPFGLIAKVYPIGANSPIVIKWNIPFTKVSIFEWDYDAKNGSHYHVMLPSMNNSHLEGGHYLPGDAVPEPWNSLFFGDVSGEPWNYLE